MQLVMDFEVRTSWIRVDPKCNDWCLSKRRKDTDTERRGHVMMETEIEVMPTNAKDCWQHQKLEEAGRNLQVSEQA